MAEKLATVNYVDLVCGYTAIYKGVLKSGQNRVNLIRYKIIGNSADSAHDSYAGFILINLHELGASQYFGHLISGQCESETSIGLTDSIVNDTIYSFVSGVVMHTYASENTLY